MKQWLICTLTGAVVGFILGYALLWGWFFLRLILLGYRDSGPPWIITVNDIVFYGGLVTGIIAGQLFFVFKRAR